MHTIKRNKKIFDYIEKQLKRLKISQSIKEIFEQYIIPEVDVADVISVAGALQNISPDILDLDSVLIETLKFVGIMEVSKNEEELVKLNDKRKQIKDTKKELNDFDKLLTGIMKVPLKDKKEKK